MSVVVIDYGMGNIHSITSAVEYLGHSVFVSHEWKVIRSAEYLILPGVGSFARAMTQIKQLELKAKIEEAMQSNGASLLGICLGMQLLGVSSPEDGYTKGLCFIENRIEKFTSHAPKIPHIGFNEVDPPKGATLFRGIEPGVDFYFVHSYRMEITDRSATVATCKYGDLFAAAVEKDRVFGTQFHPELSQGNGLRVLANFFEARNL